MTQENTEEDVLAPLKNMDYQSSDGIHMKTYTAGEDGSRLAQMAKEFGLAHQRQPRQQVRKRVPTPLQTFTGQVIKYSLDPGFADVRMRAVYYTSHGQELAEYDALYGEIEKEGEVDPHAQGVGGDLTSSVLGIIKGMVGPAILYLPHGFATAGYVVALPIMAITTCLFLYSSTCLLESWRLESTKGPGGEQLSLLEQGSSKKKRVILSYPELAYRALGPTGEMMVKLGIALMQSGVCLTYMIFVPQNLSTCTNILFNLQIPPSYFMIVMLVCQIPLSWIRDIRKFTITNLLANLLILYGLITCIFFALNNAVKSEAGRGPLEEIGYKLTHMEPFNSGWFLFIGTSVLLFEGSITLLVPLQEAVATAEDRAKFPAIYQRVILSIIAFYGFFGITCWMSFGQEVRTSLTTSLPEGVMATTVQLAYSIGVMATFPLQNFPSLEIATRSIKGGMKRSCGSSTSFFQKRNVISSFLVCVLAVVAISTMDSLDKVVSLMGSLLGCPIAFVFPPLIHLKLDPDLTPSRKRGNLIVAGFGMCAMILASVTTLITW